jgi:hypothetical protein
MIIKPYRRNGYSLVAWTATLAVVVAAVLFIRAPLKRALQTRMMATTDYMFWTRWGNSTQQYKGETNSYVKTQATQSFNTTQLERKDKHISSVAESKVREDTVSSGVEEGAQPALKTFDLNDILH